MMRLLQRNITDMSKSKTVIDQNALNYTRRWSPDHTPEFLSLRDAGPKVRYLRAGQGPVLVLLHSIRTQLDLFQRVIPKLTDHFTVYAFDFPGFGWSEIIPGADYREPAMRAHVVDFIERLDLRDVTLVGESMGATLALTTAAVLGDRVKRVIAFNPYDYLPGVERANLLASVIVKSVRAPLIGPIFAAMESPATVAGILKGGFYDPRSLAAGLYRRIGERRETAGLLERCVRRLSRSSELRRSKIILCSDRRAGDAGLWRSRLVAPGRARSEPGSDQTREDARPQGREPYCFAGKAGRVRPNSY